jgi:replicative DNA helicase
MSEHGYVDIATERALLGSVVFESACWDTASTVANERCFTGAVRPLLWRLVAGMYRERKPVDTLTVIAAAREAKVDPAALTEEIAPWAHASQLPAAAEQYARTLRDLAITREARGHVLRYLEQPPGDGEVKIGQLQRSLAGIDFGQLAGFQTLREAMESLGLALKAEARGEKGTEQISTGMSTLDKVVNGLMPGLLHVYAGRPGSGKSALATAMLCALGEAGVPTAVFWLEDMVRMLALRVAASVGSIPANCLLHGKNMAVEGQKPWWSEFAAAQAKVYDWPIYVEPSQGITRSVLTQRMRALAREKGVRVFLTDHFGRLRLDGGERSDMELGQAAQDYLEEAARLNACPVAFHQLAKRAEDGGTSALGWLFNSDYLAQHARVVGYVAHNEDKFRIDFVKVTYGTDTRRIYLGWDGPRMRVFEPTKEMVARWKKEKSEHATPAVQPVQPVKGKQCSEPVQGSLPVSDGSPSA